MLTRAKEGFGALLVYMANIGGKISIKPGIK
jgi:hypothetical protein